MTEVTPPVLWMLWGTGTAFRGYREPLADGSYVATVWFHCFFLPILPFESYRIGRGQTDNIWVPGLFSHSKTRFVILAHVPTSGKHIALVYSFVVPILLVLGGALWYAVRLPTLESSVKSAFDVALSEFGDLHYGEIKGITIPSDEDSEQKDARKRMLPWDRPPSGSYAYGVAIGQLRGLCAHLCAKKPTCLAFAFNSPYSPSCSFYRLVEKATPLESGHKFNAVYFGLRKQGVPDSRPGK